MAGVATSWPLSECVLEPAVSEQQADERCAGCPVSWTGLCQKWLLCAQIPILADRHQQVSDR